MRRSDRAPSTEKKRLLNDIEQKSFTHFLFFCCCLGSLAAYLCSFLGVNKRLFIFGCHGDKIVEVEKNLKKIGISSILSKLDVHYSLLIFFQRKLRIFFQIDVIYLNCFE